MAVVEDEWIWASGVQFQLERASGIDFAGSASAVADALDLIERERPDVVLLDLMLGTESALPVARTVAQRRLDARIVVVTAEPSPWALAEAESCGVRGFVAKEALVDPERLVALVRSVAAGGTVFEYEDPVVAHGLTPAEVGLILAFRDCGTTDEIARRLNIGRQTVNNRTTAVGRKLGVSGRANILAAALAKGIVGTGRRRP